MKSAHWVLGFVVTVVVVAGSWSLAIAAEGGSLPPAASNMPANSVPAGAPASNPNIGPLIPEPVAVPSLPPVAAPVAPGNVIPPAGPGNTGTQPGPQTGQVARPAEEPKVATTVVKITDKGFDPAKVTIKAGETVQWRNESTSTQSMTADSKLTKTKSSVNVPKGATSFSSGELIPGGIFSHDFTTSGSYKYVSLKNESMGGSVTVKESQTGKKETRKATKATTKPVAKPVVKKVAKKPVKKARKPAPEFDPNL